MHPLNSFFRKRLKSRHASLLIALDDYRSINKVASVLHLTQPAISKALAELETGMGLRLFERAQNRLIPTIYGECLIRHAREWERDFTAARTELLGLVTGTSGQVNVGVLAGAAAVLLPKALALMKKQSPNTSVMVREGPSNLLIPELRLGKLDMLVGTIREQHASRDLERLVLVDIPPALIVRKGHPLTRVRKLGWHHLKDLPWVVPPIGALMREPLEATFERNEMSMPLNVIETHSMLILCAYVGWSDAVAVVPRDVALHYARIGTTQTLKLELPSIGPVGVVWSRQRALQPGAHILIEALKVNTPPEVRN